MSFELPIISSVGASLICPRAEADFPKSKRSELSDSIAAISETALPRTISELSDDELKKYSRSSIDWREDRRLLNSQREIKNTYETCVDNDFFFRKIIRNLNSEDIIFDSGCGQGRAGEDYVRIYPKEATYYGVTITRPKKDSDDEAWIERDNLERLHLFLYDMLEFPTFSLNGRVSVVMDIHGAFSYSSQPSKILFKLAEMLKTQGKLFLTFQNLSIDVSPYEDKIALSKKIRTMEDGSLALLMLYFISMKGLKIIEPEKLIPENVLKSLGLIGLIKDNPFDWGLFMNYPFLIRDKKFWCFSIVFERTKEPIAIDPLSKIESLQTYDPNKMRKLFWKVSDRNTELINKIEEIKK